MDLEGYLSHKRRRSGSTGAHQPAARSTSSDQRALRSTPRRQARAPGMPAGRLQQVPGNERRRPECGAGPRGRAQAAVCIPGRIMLRPAAPRELKERNIELENNVRPRQF